MSNIYSYYTITRDYLVVKFLNTMNTATLVNGNFVLSRTDSTPNEIVNPFLDIDLIKDYQSISRTLFLWWNTDLVLDATYSLSIENLQTLTKLTLATETIEFTADSTLVSQPPSRPSRDPVDVEDYSVKNVTIIDNSSLSADSSDKLLVTEVSPTLKYQVSAYDNFGKINIEFSETIAGNFVNNKDFNLQKKSLSNGVHGWVNVGTSIYAGPNGKKVFIYLPSQDATPVYSYEVEDASGRVFWEPGYKYRLIISSNVGI